MNVYPARPVGSYKTTWAHVLRWVLHFPVGLIIAHLILRVDPVLGVVVAVFFLAYEWMEQKCINDMSFIDIFGSLLMLIAGGYSIWFWF
jgi:hypothetical protein